MNIADDLNVLLADLGVVVSAGGKTAKGLLDDADEEVLAGGGPAQLLGRSIVVTLRTGSIDVAAGSALTVNGTSYIARDIRKLDDGLLTRIFCSKA